MAKIAVFKHPKLPNLISRKILLVVKLMNFHTVRYTIQCYTVWKNEKFSLTKKIFRQIYSFYSVKLLLSRNFCQNCVGEISRIFHTVCYTHTMGTVWKSRNFTATIFSEKFRESNILLKNFTLNTFDEKKFAWQ